jgi:hypothetical protein
MDDKIVRKQLITMLEGGEAHVPLQKAVKVFPPELRGTIPRGCWHSAWQLVEHLRIALWDIVEFTLNPDHVWPDFPDGYWPDSQEPPDTTAWDRSVESLLKELDRMIDIVADESNDLTAPIEHGEGQTILREALLVVKHDSYHLGQLVCLAKCLEIWK